MEPKEKPSVLHSALNMAAGTTTSRILGFIRDALMFALFPRSVTDAFVVAFRLPNLFRRVLGEGALSLSFVPVFVEARRRSVAEGEQVAAQVFTVLVALTSVLSVVGFVYMDQIIGYWIGESELTVWMARIMIFYLVLVTNYAFHTAVLNSLGEFFIPAMGPTLFNLGLITFTISPFNLGPHAGSAQAWGVIFGGLLQAGIVYWWLVKLGHTPRLLFTRWGAPVKKVFADMVPGIFALGFFQLISLVNTGLAAVLSEGSQSYLYAADRVLELPQSLIAVSLGTALLPRFAELSSDRHGFLNEASQAIKLLLFLTLPAAIGMWALAGGITEVLFMRGAFDQQDAVATAGILEVYAVLLLFSGVSRVLLPAFYATKNVWLPVGLGLLVLLGHLLVAPYMVEFHGLRGLAMATAFSTVLNLVLMQVFFHAKIGGLNYLGILKSAVYWLPGGLALGLFCTQVYPQLLDGGVPRILSLGLVIVGGIVIYLGMALLLGSREAKQLSARLNIFRK